MADEFRPMNNIQNRIALAMTIVNKVEKHTLRALAEMFLLKSWSDSHIKFQSDAKSYGEYSDIPWTDNEDEKEAPKYRCHYCHSFDIEGEVVIQLNTREIRGDPKVGSYYNCLGCLEHRGDGEIRYVEEWDEKAQEYKVK